MGFFDTVKTKAGGLAADAERAGRVTAAQTKIAALQQDLKKAERELGHRAFALAARGELEHPELALAIERVRDAQGAIDAKEAEVAGLRAAGDTPEEAARCAPAAPRSIRRPASAPSAARRWSPRWRLPTCPPPRRSRCRPRPRRPPRRRLRRAPPPDSPSTQGVSCFPPRDRHRRTSPRTGAAAPVLGRGV